MAGSLRTCCRLWPPRDRPWFLAILEGEEATGSTAEQRKEGSYTAAAGSGWEAAVEMAKVAVEPRGGAEHSPGMH